MKRSSNYDFTDKWTTLIAQSGHTALPNLLIEHQRDLGISNGEMVVIIGLLAKKWSKKHPYPSVGTLGKNSGMASQTIRGHLRTLEKKQLLTRRFRQGTSNEYDFGPLITKLEVYAQATARRIKKQKPPYSNLASPPYSNTDTKEDAAIENTKRKRRSYASSGKPTAIGEILGSRYRG